MTINANITPAINILFLICSLFMVILLYKIMALHNISLRHPEGGMIEGSNSTGILSFETLRSALSDVLKNIFSFVHYLWFLKALYCTNTIQHPHHPKQ